MAGKDKDTKQPTAAYYDAENLSKKSGNYHNSAHFLLKNYPNEEFYFLTTKKARDYQEDLIDLTQKNIKDIILIEDNSLEDIYENIFKIIKKSKSSEIILDVTHGFRHQPISAIFAAILDKFLNSDINLKIIFAKQIEAYKKYEYIYLDNYINLTQLSLLLTGFIRTLNFVNTVEIDGLNTLAFEKFSKALLSNDFIMLESSYKNLTATINQAKKDKRFDHFEELFKKIEDTLAPLKNFKKSEIYQKYLILSELMLNKGYFLLSLTYLFEAMRLYSSYSFYKNGIIQRNYWKKADSYTINSKVMHFITQKYVKDYKNSWYDENYPKLFKNNEKKFEKIAKVYIDLRDLRNNLTHINHNQAQPDVKNNLQTLLRGIQTIINEDILKNIKH